MWSVAAVLIGFAVVSITMEPRRFRCALWVLAAVVTVTLTVVSYVLALDILSNIGAYIALGVILIAILLVVVPGVFLVLNGFIVVTKEGRRPVNLLGVVLGVVMLVYTGVAIYSVINNDFTAFLAIACIGLPLAYLGFGFVAFLLYGFGYQWVTRRRIGEVVAVVVLGAGLIRGSVTPLLASRLNKGIAVREQLSDEPLLIVSGGQGSDEVRSEASAMEEFLVDKGIPGTDIVAEDRSRTTRENLENCKVILAERGLDGRVAVVTNTFHAFRAALLMQRIGIPGYAVGSPTARYFWPTAVIREYVAILSESVRGVLIGLAASFIPLVVFIVRLFI
jgi:uncharacterized SAM-binding protein YcdF (DUF218 family)